MKTSHRTLALLTGASLAALGLAMPAAAAPVSEPGIGHTGLVASDTLTICSIDTDPDAPDCTFGTIDLGGVGGVAVVDVDTVAEGQIRQTAPAAPGDITLNIVNDGDAEIYAVATGTSSAQAVINSAIMQTAVAVGNATLNIDNNGILLIDAIASSTGTIPDATVTIAPGILQDVTSTGAGDALANFTNDGTLTILASANAISTGANSAIANASISAGVSQIANAAGDIAGVSFTNNGAVAITANALASGTATASANAYVLGVNQSAVGGTANATFVNAATLTVAANATATGGEPYATANATASGLIQTVTGTVAGNAVATNSGTMTVTANAAAVAGDDAAVDNATANAYAYGIQQYGNGTAATETVTNEGTLNVGAHATATAQETAHAYASASGVYQYDQSTANVVRFTNNGEMNVNAAATATATGAVPVTSTAQAYAVGYHNFIGGPGLDLSVVNAGTMNVSATAVAGGVALATATGMYISANAGAGVVVNSGTLNVVANASGATSTATAIGISAQRASGTQSIVNEGSINVDAIGGSADAVGITVGGCCGATAVTIDNSGDLIVRESTDGGDTFTRGLAMDLAGNVLGTTTVNLLGGGNIFGDIDVKAGDDINVTDGETAFNGIINPELVPVGGIVAATLDSGLSGQGDLTIGTDGTLFMVNDPDLGPSYAIVDTLTFDATGTLALDLTPTADGGVQDVGTYPQIFTNTATLDGTLEARLQPVGTLFADTTVWDNVIDANVRAGTFDQCVIGGDFAGSIFLDTACVYDANNNVDLVLSRVGFDEIAGLGPNAAAAAAGLECIYDPTLTGGIANLLGDLFLITDPADFNVAALQLSGVAYANYLQSFRSLGVHYNDMLDGATSCEVPALAGSVIECRASSPIHIWGQIDYQRRKVDDDGDIDAGDYKASRFTGQVGIDYTFANAFILGVGVGAVNNHVDDHLFDDKMNADGWQAGLYGVYDPGAFYVKAMTSYSWFDGDSRRRIDLTGFGPNITTVGDIEGDPDVNMWTFGLHGGYRVAMGTNSVLTPYLNFDHVNAKLKEFEEVGVTNIGEPAINGANLTVFGGRVKNSYLTGGVKWAGQFGGIVPEANIGYRYRLGGDSRAEVGSAFLGDEHCEFLVESVSEKRGTFLAGLSAGGKLGPIDLRLSYEGEFNGDITSHSGRFRVILPFGGRAAPPPPPPPPPVVEAPPPPPPPPPPSGERGK